MFLMMRTALRNPSHFPITSLILSNVNVLIIYGFNVCQVSVTKNVFQCPCTAELGDTEDGPR